MGLLYASKSSFGGIKEGETISSLSLFVVHKTIMSIAGEPKSIKNLRSVDLLIQCAKESDKNNLLQMKTVCGLKCSVTPHSSLNTSTGIIRCPALNSIQKMISKNCKIVIRITNKFILMGQRKTQRLVVLSKEDSKVGCAVISDNHSNMQRIPDDSSIFTAEAKAVDLALDFVSTCDDNNKFIIFSDSLSVLIAMNHTSSKNPQIQKLLEKCHELLAYKEIVIVGFLVI